MIPDPALVLGVLLLALSLAAGSRRRPAIAGQLGGLGAALLVLALVGDAGGLFAVIVAACASLAGLLVSVLTQRVDELGETVEDPAEW